MTNVGAAVYCLSKEWDQTKEGWQSGLWGEERSVGLISLWSSPSAWCAPCRSRKLTKASQRRYIQTHGTASQGIIDSSPLTQRHCMNLQSHSTHARTHQTPLKVNYIQSCTLQEMECNPPPPRASKKPATIGSVWFSTASWQFRGHRISGIRLHEHHPFSHDATLSLAIGSPSCR